MCILDVKKGVEILIDWYKLQRCKGLFIVGRWS